MKKGNAIEIIAILSLSFILTSTYSVSGVVPTLLEAFPFYSRSSIEFLVSIPSISMIVMIALSPLLAKFFSERSTIVSGLGIAGVAGITPFFTTSFSMIFISRLITGVGFGLINTCAISMISERFTGKKRAHLLGYRTSIETLGQAILTLIAGQLLVWGWQPAFLIYSIAFPLLALYLLFVPNKEVKTQNTFTKEKLHLDQLLPILTSALFGGLLIATNTANSLRIPSYIVENNLASTLTANRVLSLFMFAGFIGGAFFGKLFTLLKKYFLTVLLFAGGLGLIFIPLSTSIYFIAIGAFLSGFTITSTVSSIFTRLPEKIPLTFLNTANAMVLIGCNLGATIAPLLLNWIGKINAGLDFPFIIFAIIFFIISAGSFWHAITSKQ
ncbi:MAG: MFS transporter [Tetragenococcus halophilus]|nr:MFS transporter [Tetragenococcus halophilus]